MFNRNSPFHLPVFGLVFLFYILLLGFLFIVVQLQAIRYAFETIGISSQNIFLLLLLCIFGSMINIPLTEIKASPQKISDKITRFMNWRFKGFLGAKNRTIIAINVGGALIPLLISVYLLITHPWLIATNLFATLVMSAVVYKLARPVSGVGIGVPLLIPPVFAAFLGLILGGDAAPVVAYTSGTLGTLIGADIFNLKVIARSGAPVASIGGAGTFDGVFLTGIIAVLLASL